jgi:hypothetical protein
MGAEQEQAFDPAPLKVGLMLTKPGYDLFLVHNCILRCPLFYPARIVASRERLDQKWRTLQFPKQHAQTIENRQDKCFIQENILMSPLL